VQAYCRKFDSEAAGEMDASLCSFDELRDLSVARIETGVRVDDADQRSGECIFAVTGGFDEYFPQEEGEVRVAV
jgi:hypothetical protein